MQNLGNFSNPFQVKQEELDLFDAAIEPSGGILLFVLFF